MQKICPTHGLTTFNARKEGGARCGKCASEAVIKRRKKLKLMAVEYMGGACSSCGYSKCLEALEFHHLDPSVKDFGISQAGGTRSFEKIKEELQGCVMLCANCHREAHAADF